MLEILFLVLWDSTEHSKHRSKGKKKVVGPRR